MLSADRLWVAAVIDRVRDTVGNPILASFFAFGWIPIVTSGSIFLASETVDQSFILFQSLTASIVVLGPYQAYKYDTSVLPEFFTDVEELVADPDVPTLDDIKLRAIRRFRTKHPVFVVLWTVAVVSVLPLNASYFASQGIVFGSALYVVYLIFLIDFGVLSGLGLFSVAVTIHTIWDVSKLELHIEPLHPDGLGGLSVFGDFAIASTLLISNGALAIPLSFDMVTSDLGGVIVYSGVGLYILFIITSFVYPTYRINRKAQALREEHLDQFRSKIRRLETNLSENTQKTNSSLHDLELRLEIDRLRKEFQNYRDVRLYPLSIGIVVRLASSVLLPIGFTLFDIFLPRFL